MECKARVDILQKKLKEKYLTRDAESFVESIKSSFEKMESISLDIELVFRGLLDDIISETTVNKMMEDDSSVRKLIDFSFDLIQQNGTQNFGRIPYLLFADLLEGQTIGDAERLWEMIESSIKKLTDPDSFRMGKFIILKACNTLLRRLSRSCNPEFCGRVLMFLAAIYPISERSAVNFAGKINTANITDYEDEKTFQNMNKPQLLANLEDINDEIDKDINKNEKNEKNGIVDYDSDAEKKTEKKEKILDAMDLDINIDIKIESLEKLEVSKSEDESQSKYELYELFWGLQTFMSTENTKCFEENAKNDLNATVDSNPAKARPAAEAQRGKWAEVMDHTNTVLKTFEEAGFSEQEVQAMILARKNEKNIKNENEINDEKMDQYFGCKYLTSSELLSLQIRDPFF